MSYGPEAFQADTGASDQAMADLGRFRELLIEANAVMNLVGPSTLADFWIRHALDSAQLLKLAPTARTWADLGAGAGFPGVVLAILLKDRAGAHVHLIDSLGKRCRFLEQAVTELALPATVVNGRAEDQRLKVEVVTARAVAPLDRLLDYAQGYLDRGARGLFLKGRKAEAELAEARRRRRISAQLIPSATDPESRIVSIESARLVR
ncbi:16S rRNA (guanine(527)-N(7))-methyltransferase RsmG [Brevundimonas sp. 2R-24]|uniref:Ribosomal RNA small subunit methyltransferase G n=1 Tax=Peiella sedimenti TaxID=3061083 RepID=A0ABT8SKJ8_9CAUL|nr:16S rRNA (guanine(527)-N(7))-methyltransferase RsmG [Caulobacteraceae bacterium XZ-24]